MSWMASRGKPSERRESTSDRQEATSWKNYGEEFYISHYNYRGSPCWTLKSVRAKYRGFIRNPQFGCPLPAVRIVVGVDRFVARDATTRQRGALDPWWRLNWGHKMVIRSRCLCGCLKRKTPSMPRETYNARYLSASPSYLTVPRRGSSHLRHTPRGKVEAGVLRRSIESISTVSRRISTGIPAARPYGTRF